MVKKEKKEKKEKEGKTKKLKDLHLEELESVPLVGGLFKGLSKLVDLAEKVEESGGKIERRGEIKGLTPKHPRAIWGFTTSILDKNKKPSFKIEPFGNIKETKKGPKISEEREPIVDVFDEKKYVLVIAELPGVAEESIKLELKKDILILEAGDEKRKYKKEVLLPRKVDPRTKKVSYRNGILQIKFKKVKK